MPEEVSVSPPLLGDCAFFFTSLHSPPVTLIELTVFGEITRRKHAREASLTLKSKLTFASRV